MEPYLNLRFGVLVEKWWLAIQVSAARDSVWLVLFFLSAYQNASCYFDAVFLVL